MKKMSALLLLLLTGCENPFGWSQGNGHYHVWLDPTWDDPQIEIIHKSVDTWEAAVGSVITFEYWDSDCGPPENNSLTIVPSTRASLSLSDSTCWEKDGWVLGTTVYDGSSALIQIAEDMPDDYLSKVSLHELGHAIGLDHSKKNTVMYWLVEGSTDYVTCDDAKQFCDEWDCNANKLPPCMP